LLLCPIQIKIQIQISQIIRIIQIIQISRRAQSRPCLGGPFGQVGDAPFADAPFPFAAGADAPTPV
jgi:hypothetical protein